MARTWLREPRYTSKTSTEESKHLVHQAGSTPSQAWLFQSAPFSVVYRQLDVRWEVGADVETGAQKSDLTFLGPANAQASPGPFDPRDPPRVAHRERIAPGQQWEQDGGRQAGDTYDSTTVVLKLFLTAGFSEPQETMGLGQGEATHMCSTCHLKSPLLSGMSPDAGTAA